MQAVYFTVLGTLTLVVDGLTGRAVWLGQLLDGTTVRMDTAAGWAQILFGSMGNSAVWYSRYRGVCGAIMSMLANVFIACHDTITMNHAVHETDFCHTEYATPHVASLRFSPLLAHSAAPLHSCLSCNGQNSAWTLPSPPMAGTWSRAGGTPASLDRLHGGRRRSLQPWS